MWIFFKGFSITFINRAVPLKSLATIWNRYYVKNCGGHVGTLSCTKIFPPVPKLRFYPPVQLCPILPLVLFSPIFNALYCFFVRLYPHTVFFPTLIPYRFPVFCTVFERPLYFSPDPPVPKLRICYPCSKMGISPLHTF